MVNVTYYVDKSWKHKVNLVTKCHLYMIMLIFSDRQISKG